MGTITVRALNVGAVKSYGYEGKSVDTAFFKRPVAGPVLLTSLGFAGDQQADQVHHGGPEKAALLYSFAHYAYWEQELGKDPGPAALGENLTVEGLTEETACIGDVYRIGQTAVVQVCQPRIPCFKTNIRQGIPDMLARVSDTGFTGFYVRVLTEGPVAAGDELTLLSRPAGAPTIAEANHIMHRDRDNMAAAERLLAAEGLAEVWRTILLRRLAKSV